LIPIFSISVAQGDFSVFDFEDAVIGERYAVSVAAEVIEDSLRRAEGLFRVDGPVRLRNALVSLLAAGSFVLSSACCSRSRNFPRNTRLRAFTGNKKFFARGYPAAVIERESACGHQTVQMKMIFKLLIPGV
jgi:hypothetical protein